MALHDSSLSSKLFSCLPVCCQPCLFLTCLWSFIRGLPVSIPNNEIASPCLPPGLFLFHSICALWIWFLLSTIRTKCADRGLLRKRRYIAYSEKRKCCVRCSQAAGKKPKYGCHLVTRVFPYPFISRTDRMMHMKIKHFPWVCYLQLKHAAVKKKKTTLWQNFFQKLLLKFNLLM